MTNDAEPVRIFFDASQIGPAKALAPDDARIVYPGHPAWPFDQDEADEVWLPHVGGDNWLTIMRDRKVRFRTAEKAALIEYRVRAVNVATITNLTVAGTVALLRENWEAIEATLASPPAFYHLTKSGLIRMLTYDE